MVSRGDEVDDVVVMLDGRAVAPDEPVVGPGDPLFARGDGVFETLLVRAGRPTLLEAHLTRLATSATRVGLPEPELDSWRAAVGAAVTAWGAADEGVLRLVYGRTGADGTLGFATVSPVPARVAAARRDGVSAVTVDAGRGDAAPWSVAGAKSVSYARHAAALRHAQRLGADDAVLLAGDEVLEGPRSAVLCYADGEYVTPPPGMLPILPGITVRAVFDVATARGLPCRHAILRRSDLLAAQGVWLLSSITLAARVHTLDGTVLPAAPTASELAALVDVALTRER
jgi:4-amino-4-deoxychorismate lyase